MKRVIFTIILAALICGSLAAQQVRNERVEAEKVAFFTRKLNLTPDEAREFWPVYNDYVARRDRIIQERNTLVRYVNQNSANLTEKELDESGDKIVQSMLDEAKLAVEYHSKFKEILPAEKVLRIYQAENQFKQILLNQLRDKRSGQLQRRMPL